MGELPLLLFKTKANFIDLFASLFQTFLPEGFVSVLGNRSFCDAVFISLFVAAKYSVQQFCQFQAAEVFCVTTQNMFV